MNAPQRTVPLRAALYLRVSTARQAEHDVSIPDQRKQGDWSLVKVGDTTAALMNQFGNLLQSAVRLHNLGQLKEAIDLYNKVLLWRPNDAQLLLLLGTAYNQVAQLELGITHIERSLAINPNNPDALVNVGLALHGLNRLDEALSSYDKALAIAPRSIDALTNRGLLLKDMQRYLDGLADLFLDTWPYNAHTTASDALWAGLPVLTYVGKSFASRVGASLLTAVGLPELIARSQDMYEAMAIALALDVERLKGIREVLAKNRISSPLFQGKMIASKLETCYEAIYSRYQSGHPPADLNIN